MFKNPRRDKLARNFAKNVQKILDLKSSSEQILVRKLPLGAPVPILVILEPALNPALLSLTFHQFSPALPSLSFYEPEPLEVLRYPYF